MRDAPPRIGRVLVSVQSAGPSRVLVLDGRPGMAEAPIRTVANGLAGRLTPGTPAVMNGEPHVHADLVLVGGDTAATPGAVYVIGAGHAGSASHTLALLAHEAIAVVDLPALLVPPVVDAVVGAWRGHAQVVAGVPAAQFAALREEVLDDWPTYAFDDSDRVSFRAASALARLPRLHSPAGTHWTQLADALNAASRQTNFVYNRDTLRRVLSRLGLIWAPAEELDEEDELARESPGLHGDARAFLPQLAREHGFTDRSVTLPGIAPGEVDGRLYDVLAAATVVEEVTSGEVKYLRIARKQ